MSLITSLFDIHTESAFLQKAIEIFQFQYHHNKVYQQFVDFLKVHPASVTSLNEIPFLPISFFKTHQVVSFTDAEQAVFLSSATTGSVQSNHYVKDLQLYEQSFQKGFSCFYNAIDEYTILALLPSYLEREGSSLIYMVDDMIQQSKKPSSGFYLHNLDELAIVLKNLDANGEKVLLIGVSYALLDLIELYTFELKNTVIMETGGMKGKRKELVKEELHRILKAGFGVKDIHSEYGMTELLSQAYSQGNGLFQVPSWMKILIRDTEDPLSILPFERAGGINVIDLANIYSCSFIATQDLGKSYNNGSFEVLGRFDYSDIRGCNLMVSDI